MDLSNEIHIPQGVNQVLSLLEQNQTAYQIRLFKEPAHHASEAADLLGCPLGAIVKSLVFQKDSTREILLVLVSGKNRVDLDKLGDLVVERIHPASPQEVKKKTGYPVGAVPPFSMLGDFSVFIDEDLMDQNLVWSSAGAVNILLGMSPVDLKNLSGGSVEMIKEMS
jgi:Cys-tRNA(Pro) deacylase